MSFGAGLVVGIAALVIILAVSDVVTRRRRREAHPSKGGRTEECEICGAEISIVVTHLVTAGFADDASLGNTFGGTGMSAAYCSNHCPGGCSQGCAS